MERMESYFTNQRLRSEAEILQQQIESRELTDLSRARFADRLAPQFEQAWTNLLSHVNETNLHIEDLMTPVWLNDSVPQVFRDRAMLTLVGSEGVRKTFAPTRLTTNFAFFLCGGIPAREFKKDESGSSLKLFHRWMQDAWHYQQETGLPIINNPSYLRWQYEFYAEGLTSDEQIDEFVDKIDIKSSSPTCEGSGWDGNDYPLNPERFPLLDDIFHKRVASTNTTRVREWALEKLTDWINYQKGDDVDLPSWLREVPLEVGLKLCQGLVKRGDKLNWLSWDSVSLMDSLFGLKIFGDNLDLATVLNISDPGFKAKVLKTILERQNENAKAGKRYSPLLSVIFTQRRDDTKNIPAREVVDEVLDRSTDPELKELLELELKHADEYGVRQKQEREEFRRKYNAEHEAKHRVSPEHQARKEAYVTFLGKVANLAKLTEEKTG